MKKIEAALDQWKRGEHILRGGSEFATLVMSDPEHGKVVRKVGSGKKIEKLKAQYVWLCAFQQDAHVPIVLGAGGNDLMFYYDMKFVNGEPLFDVLQRISTSEAIQQLETLLHWLAEAVHAKSVHIVSDYQAQRYLREKLQAKLAAATTCSPVLEKLCRQKVLNINGRDYPNATELVAAIMKSDKILRQLSSYAQCDLHGDVTIDNILVSDGGQLVVLDPNDENYVSDPIVDYAKLLQSLWGKYEFLQISNGIEVDESGIRFAEVDGKVYSLLEKTVRDFLKNSCPSEQSALVDLHVAIHFARLLPYKVLKDIERAPLYYATFVRLLSTFVDEHHELLS